MGFLSLGDTALLVLEKGTLTPYTGGIEVKEAPSLGWTGKAAEGKGARSGVQRKGGCYLGLVSLRAS